MESAGTSKRSGATANTVLSPAKRVKRKTKKFRGWGAKPKSYQALKNPRSEALKDLEEIPNPFEEFEHGKLKLVGVFMFYSSLTAWPSEPVIRKDVYELVAANLCVSWRTVQNWVIEYEKEGKIGESHWGKHTKTQSPMNNSEFR